MGVQEEKNQVERKKKEVVVGRNMGEKQLKLEHLSITEET